MKIIILAAAIALTGCVTSPISPSMAKLVPADRLYAKPTPDSDAEGKLVVTRDIGLQGSGCFMGFYLDGELAAKYDTGETAAFKVSPGEHIVGIGNPGGGGTLRNRKRISARNLHRSQAWRCQILPDDHASRRRRCA